METRTERRAMLRSQISRRGSSSESRSFRHMKVDAVSRGIDCGKAKVTILVPQMVIASHIKPYYVCDKSERANPANGLLLNAFYDRAFDQGLMTVLPDLTIQVSDYVKDSYDDQNTKDWLLGVEGTKIIRPKRFAPNRDMLAYHNEFVFLR